MNNFEKGLLKNIIDYALERVDVCTHLYVQIKSESVKDEIMQCTLNFINQDERSKLEEFDEIETIKVSYEIRERDLFDFGDEIHFFYENGPLGVIQIDNKSISYTQSQQKALKTLMKTSKRYTYIREAFDWYSREKAFYRIAELLEDHLIAWEEKSREVLEFDDEEIHRVKYGAEYGDENFTLSMSEEHLEEIWDSIEDHSAILPMLEIKIGDYYENIISHLTVEELETIYMRKPSVIEFKDVLVRTANAQCIEKSHVVEEINATVNILKRGTSHREEYVLKAYYCRNCNRCYILENEFIRLKRIGTICCKVINLNDLKQSGDWGWANQSILRQYGYTVNQSDNLSRIERQTILDLVISNEVMSRDEVIDFLEWLLNRNSGNRNMDQAIKKWNEDIDYLRGGKYPKATNFKIRNIFESK